MLPNSSNLPKSSDRGGDRKRQRQRETTHQHRGPSQARGTILYGPQNHFNFLWTLAYFSMSRTKLLTRQSLRLFMEIMNIYQTKNGNN